MRKKSQVESILVKMVKEAEDGYAYRCINGLAVIQSWEMHDGKEWMHTSFSRKSRMPDYHDMKWVKDNFIGTDESAIMILPEESKHVNIHPYCLHFFTGDDGLPDFTCGSGSL